MNQTFNIVRFGRTLRWLYTYESRKVLNLFLLATVVFAVYQVNEMYHKIQYEMFCGVPIPQRNILSMLLQVSNISLFFLTFLMCFGATFAFSTLHRRHAGRQLLMLPASNVEKFMALWLIYVPLLFVVLILAFFVSDLLRIIILPLLTENGHQPSAIPYFFSNMWRWIGGQHVGINMRPIIIQAWALIFVIHSLCLLSSVVAGNVGWLLSALTFYGYAYFFIDSYGHYAWQVPLLITLTIVFLLFTYRLFCRFPLFPSLYSFRFHGI